MLFGRIRDFLVQKMLGELTLQKILLLAFGGGAGILLVGLLAYQVFESTESTSFCGKVCHEPMYPEYTTYQASPHSTVPCSSCHVGAGTYNLVTSKLRGVNQIYTTLTSTFERPISSPVKDMRPARETCEKCHTPQKFSGNIVHSRSSFKADAVNTEQTNTVVLKLGGGTLDVAQGIHWHIVSRVWYLPADEDRLKIAWVGVEKDGLLEEYVNPAEAAGVTGDRIQSGKRLMDCVDCHNRASHVFHSPEELVDRALQDGSIDNGLPYAKREAMKAVGTPSPNLDEGLDRAESLRDFYEFNYPAVYLEKQDKIDRSVDKLKEIARLTTFPEMRLDWNTHADHSGHNKPPDELMTDWTGDFDDWRTNKSPGCFRCHGVLVPAGSDAEAGTSLQAPVGAFSGKVDPGKPLDASCNLCHYSVPSQPTSMVPRSTPHPIEKLEDCLLCHKQSGQKPIPEDHPWSTNDTCVTCHKAAPPQTLPVSAPSQSSPANPRLAGAVNIPHSTSGLEDCLRCHAKSAPVPMAVNHPWSSNDTCAACHAPAPTPLPLPSATASARTSPPVSHSDRGLEDCLLCHATSAPKPLSADHPWSTKDTCSACHKPASTTAPLPGSTGPPLSSRLVPHAIRGLQECLRCHAPTGPRPFAASHPWSTNETCSACHATAASTAPVSSPSSQAPAIPHGTDGMSDCRSCHGPSGIPYPSDHTSIPDSYCTLCHRAN